MHGHISPQRASRALIAALLPVIAIVTLGCEESTPTRSNQTSGPGNAPSLTPATAGATGPVQICTAQNIQGYPVEGKVCGGQTFAPDCSRGLLYECQGGPQFTNDNCTLLEVCAVACRTHPKDLLEMDDACVNVAPPLTFTPNNVTGGAEVTATLTLQEAHPNGADVGLVIGRGDLVAARIFCNVPARIPAGVSSTSFILPTSVVNELVSTSAFVDLSFRDSGGTVRHLVSVPTTLTLNPGGTAPPPSSLESFTLAPSTIGPNRLSVMDVTLSRMAPAAGQLITVTSGDPSVASVIAQGQPFVQGGCTTGGGAATLQSARNVSQQTTVNISASSGAAGQAPLVRQLTVTAGCERLTCFETTGCGALSDGCGGNIACGCPSGQTCGGGGTQGVCGTANTLAVSALRFDPSTVAAGSASVGTVSLNIPAPARGAGVSLSSSSSAVTVPPSVVVPEGQTSATFNATTAPVSSDTVAVITAALGGTTASANLNLTPASTCSATTCAAQGKNCGTLSDGCGGTLSCGACTAPQTCGGGGVPNVCGGGGGQSTLSVTATGRSGESVTSSPAGISVRVGSTGSANFATGTLITLTVSNGRRAIWSGGCSSGGQRSTSCQLALNASTSVTANVQ